MTKLYLGVDVGTTSVRASVVNSEGTTLALCVKEIRIWNCRRNFYEQSTENIWKAVTEAVKETLRENAINSKDIKGIGFDATCSLVLLDKKFQPVSVSFDEPDEDERNVIMWMDHRAENEAMFINSTKHNALNSVGGVMSLEMQPPKLMWIKKHLPRTWEKVDHFFDLPDFLTWRATGDLSRSLCSLVCKWSFQANSGESMAWDDDFLSLIGLEDLKKSNHGKIGNKVQAGGSACGSGLSQTAAAELGLEPGTPVGASLIDAHAGALACVSCSPKGISLPGLEKRLVLIAGTSTCHIICSRKPVSVAGVWGPYFSAVVPGMWVNEGGQSAAGSLIDHMIQSHPDYAPLKMETSQKNMHISDYLNEHLQQMADKLGHSNVSELTNNFHLWPDFHGNRSPVADPSLKGMVCGLSLSATKEDLAVLYLATVQALAYGTKHIVTEMERSGHTISMVYMCGGLRKNKLYVQIHTDVLGLPVVLPHNEESVLLGAAMLGASASENFTHMEDVMATMGGGGTIVEPNPEVTSFHKKKFDVFLEMLKDQRKYTKIMGN